MGRTLATIVLSLIGAAAIAGCTSQAYTPTQTLTQTPSAVPTATATFTPPSTPTPSPTATSTPAASASSPLSKVPWWARFSDYGAEPEAITESQKPEHQIQAVNIIGEPLYLTHSGVGSTLRSVFGGRNMKSVPVNPQPYSQAQLIRESSRFIPYCKLLRVSLDAQPAAFF